MNPHQQQAIFTLLQQVKSAVAGIEQMILMADGPSVLTSSNPAQRTTPGADLKEDEDDALTKLLAKERAEAQETDATLQALWSRASAPKVATDAE